ncbi:MAG: OmpA family protein [Magnetococcales bacterium]|nr:OmpA family protein [Magnetococcales bacterium]
MEHRDRVQRLSRLAGRALSLDFRDEKINLKNHNIPGFPDPISIPILRVIAGQDYFFDSDRDDIRPEAFRLLDIIASNLKSEPPDVSLFIAGHTDSSGNQPYNLGLGLRRAQRVAEALVKRGIYQDSVYMVSFGKIMPIDSNDTEMGKAHNRRVEFLFSARKEAIVRHLEHQPIASCKPIVPSGMREHGKGTQLFDKTGNCKPTSKIFFPVKVSVLPEDKSRINALSQKEAAIKSNPSITPAQAAIIRKTIESDREKIPINLSHDKVPIVIDMQ